jgi:hypothetical protein
MLETVLLCLAISLIINGRQSKKRRWRKQSYAQIIKGNSLIVAKGVIRRTGAKGISIRASAARALDEPYQGWLSEQKVITK